MSFFYYTIFCNSLPAKIMHQHVFLRLLMSSLKLNLNTVSKLQSSIKEILIHFQDILIVQIVIIVPLFS